MMYSALEWGEKKVTQSEEEQVGMGELGMMWQKKALIKKACKWMREEFYTSKDRDGHNILVSASCDNVEELIKDFEKQMEE